MNNNELGQDNVRPATVDWFLQLLVSVVNDGDFEIGITLQVKGMLVSGFLVGGDKYFIGFADDYTRAFKEKVAADEMKSEFSLFSEKYKKNKGQQLIEDIQFIHLKAARFYNTRGMPLLDEGVWWRGRISEVDGFTLGTIGFPITE